MPCLCGRNHAHEKLFLILSLHITQKEMHKKLLKPTDTMNIRLIRIIIFYLHSQLLDY